MQITTDSGISLQVEPTQAPLPNNTPESQAIPAAGYTPAQVVTLTEQAGANPPLTPNPAELPPIVGAQPPDAGGPTRTEEAVYVPLRGKDAVDELYADADLYGIDPLASAANAIHEGAGGGIGDGGTAYGPWQIHATDGRLAQFSGRPLNSPSVQAWAWSAQGFDYAHRMMQQGGARGLTGHAAVHSIVYGFERPADEAGAYATRAAEYDRLRGMGDAVRGYLASVFGGPGVGTSIDGAVAAAPTVPTSPVYAPAGVAQGWRDIVDTFAKDTPTVERAIVGIVSDLMGVFRP